jgi:hypothetical protein
MDLQTKPIMSFYFLIFSPRHGVVRLLIISAEWLTRHPMLNLVVILALTRFTQVLRCYHSFVALAVLSSSPATVLVPS